MELNKIYRYHGVPEEEYYSHPKEKFTEAFTGFEGVSFETVEGTDETTEEYKIYLDSEKSMWLTIYRPAYDEISISISFKDGTVTTLHESTSGTYLTYNIMRTAYGVAFTSFVQNNSQHKILDEDNYFTSFFVVGEPNIFVCTKTTSNVSGSSNDMMFSSLHEKLEVHNNDSTLNGSTVPKTRLLNHTSLIYPIDCEHLYRVIYTDGKTGKIKVGEKYVILGTRYGLEYDPNDDGKEV